MNKLLGLVLIVAGVGLIYWGYDLSQAPASVVSEALTGSVTDGVLIRYIGGGIAAAIGAFFLIK